MGETCEVCGLELASVETRNLLHAGELVHYGEYRGKCVRDASCLQLGYERSQEALAAANARADETQVTLEAVDAQRIALETERVELTEALAAARRECEFLGTAFMGLRETYGLVLAFAREVLGALERGEDNHTLRVPDRTMKVLRCKDPVPTADDVLAEARLALAAPAAAAGEEGKR